MGPQFLAKLMGNQDIVANLNPDQREAALKSIYGAGTGQANAPSMGSMMQPQQSQNPLMQLMNSIGGGIKNIFGQNQAPAQQQNAMMQQPFQPQQQAQSGGIDSPIPLDANGRIPIFPPPVQKNKNYFERAAEAADIKEEGKELGKHRAEDIKNFGDTYQTSLQKQDTFNEINKIISSPEFENIRRLPAADKHELLWYKRYGNKSQQNMVGSLETLIGNVVRDSAQDFKGAFRKGEQQLIEGMKINLADTVDAARGKAEMLTFLNSMLQERTKTAYDLMAGQHLNKTEALQIADQQVNGNAIRQRIHDQINPTVTIRNRKTGETITIPASEAREKYGVG